MSTAIYLRVSSKSQDTAAQSKDLSAWIEAQPEIPKTYTDTFTGKTMRRPGWDELWADACAGRIKRIVVWRLDRLGRTVSGLAQLFEELQARGITLVSLRDGLDLGTPAGRLMAHVLASVAAYEMEVRQERQLAGIAAAQQAIREGKRAHYGTGRRPGQRWKLTYELYQSVQSLRAAGRSIAEIARVVHLSRPTVYRVLQAAQVDRLST